MTPRLYLYKETEKGFEIYLGRCTTCEGMSLLDATNPLIITEFGATCYKKYGWTTEKELPAFRNVGEFISFLRSAGDIGIVNFEATIPEIGMFRTHDDTECHFVMQSKRICMSILKAAMPLQYRDMLVNKIVSNPNLYITCSEDGRVTKYGSFDAYVAKNA